MNNFGYLKNRISVKNRVSKLTVAKLRFASYPQFLPRNSAFYISHLFLNRFYE